MHLRAAPLTAIALATLLSTTTAFAATNLVANPDFDANGGNGQVDANTTLSDWSVSGTAFVLDGNADSTGFPSVFSPNNLTLWGPGTGINNGFTGSPSGAQFLGLITNGAVVQTINGLVVGDTYTLSFDVAFAQLTTGSGSIMGSLAVAFGGDAASTGNAFPPERGFEPWTPFTFSFTATSASQNLSFFADFLSFAGTGGMALLDNISLTSNTVPAPVPEPASIALLLAGLGLVGVAARRPRHTH